MSFDDLTSEEILICEEIVQVAKRLYDRNCLAGADGNISFRVSEDKILITPTGISKGFMAPSQMAVIKLDGSIVFGRPSGERRMHLAVYRKCPEAKAVVHAHPPTAIAFSMANPNTEELPINGVSEMILAAGRVPVVNYARPGDESMGEVLLPYLPECRSMILSRHGALTWGESLNEAWMGMERLEHYSQILKSANDFGGVNDLPAEEVAALQEMRRQLGPQLL